MLTLWRDSDRLPPMYSSLLLSTAWAASGASSASRIRDFFMFVLRALSECCMVVAGTAGRNMQFVCLVATGYFDKILLQLQPEILAFAVCGQQALEDARVFGEGQFTR